MSEYNSSMFTGLESSEAYTTSSKGFEYVEGDEKEPDNRQEMETKLSKIAYDFKISMQNLCYSTDSSIEETSMNVGPQQHLEKEIQGNLQYTQEKIPAANGVNDNIPQSVMEKLTEVTVMAKSGNTSTFTASSKFDSTRDAFDYGRHAALNQFGLKKDSKRTLQEYDEKFLSVIKSQIDVEMDLAEMEMNNSFRLLAKASKESRDDQSRLEERQREEDQLVDLGQLEQIHSEANEELKGEEEEYKIIEENCQRDVEKIDCSLQELEQVLESTLSVHGNRVSERARKLSANSKEQKELEERLRQLKAEEQEYLRVKAEEEEMIKTGKTEYQRAKEDLIGWREKVDLLGKQASASLLILDVMKECTEEILNDAKQRKKAWQEKLQQLEVESLLNTRDVLMATICLHKMEAADCSINLEETEKDIAKKKTEISSAARKRFKQKVNELQAALKTNEETVRQFKEKLESHNTKMSEANHQLAIVTEGIRSLRPGISLSSIESTYRERNRIKEDCFEREGVEDARKKLHSCSIVD